jgi:hypothetical protein
MEKVDGRTLAAGTLTAWLALGASASGSPPVMGWLERIRLEPLGHTLVAKLDTGADTSSLHAREIERFERDGEEWVRFVLDVEESEEIRRYRVSRPVVRNVRIIRAERPPDRRPVIEMSFCLDGERHDAQFTLRDRSNFTTPVLLGRRFLSGAAIVDPARRRLASAECRPRAGRESERDPSEERSSASSG